MGEKSEIAGNGSIAALQERALYLIASRPEGIFQSDLRKLLEIDSSKCSKVVIRLQVSGQISRERVPASSTYLIKSVSANAATTTNAATAGFANASSAPEVNGTDKVECCHLDPDLSDCPSIGSRVTDYVDSYIGVDLANQIRRDAEGRLKMMIDSQVYRLLLGRICGQINGKTAGSIGSKINNQIPDKYGVPIENIDSQICSAIDDPIDGKAIDRIDGKIDGTINSKTERHTDSYFDCCQESDNLEIASQIDGCHDGPRSNGYSNSHIDSYLTEIFLLYLTRATSV